MKFCKRNCKKSKVKLFMVENYIQLAKFLKQNMYGKKLLLVWELVQFLTG